MSDVNNRPQSGFGSEQAQQLASVTKSQPQLTGLTSRFLVKILPWVQVRGGAYQVNRVLNYQAGGGKLVVVNDGQSFHIITRTLSELPLLANFHDREVLSEIAERFIVRRFQPGEEIVTAGSRADRLHVVAAGQVALTGTGEPALLGRGDYFGLDVLVDPAEAWPVSARAESRCVVMTLSRAAFDDLLTEYPQLTQQVDGYRAHTNQGPQRFRYSKLGLGTSHLAINHGGEDVLPTTFMDYENYPRRYDLSVAQTVLRVQSRAADLYNDPINQTEQQIRLTLEALREQQEEELLNNPDFGLLPNVEFERCLSAAGRAPTPDDFDNLITRQRSVEYLIAHPQTIAAFGRECTRLGIYPESVEWGGARVPAWRGIPVLPSKYIRVDPVKRTSSVLALRTGELNQGVIGLNQTGIPDEFEPGANVRFMNIDDKAVISYLVSLYYSAAILSPDAVGLLENVVV